MRFSLSCIIIRYSIVKGGIIIKYSTGKGGIIIKYSETSRRRSPKMRGFSSRLQGSNHRGPLPNRSSTHLRFLKEFIAYNFEVTICEVPCGLKSFSGVPNCVVRVSSGRLLEDKNNGNYKTVTFTNSFDRLQEVVVYERLQL